MVYPDIPAGARITDELLESMLPVVIVKSVAEPVTSSTALQDDNELLSAVAANAVFDVTLHLLHDSATAGDLQFTFSGPSGATMNWGMIGAQVTTTSSTTVTDVTMPSRVIDEVNALGGGPSTGTYCLAHGILTTAGTAGNIVVRWAQNASNATASNIRAGSTLIVRRIA